LVKARGYRGSVCLCPATQKRWRDKRFTQAALSSRTARGVAPGLMKHRAS